MSEREDKTPDQILDEDYKTAPTSADRDVINKEAATTTEKKRVQEGESAAPSDK
ncbi:MAG TPA: hypothetical protein VE199_01285 [Nitrososphaera sp.]|nr:hypothetical protein [Nitrososphaera sp.]